MVASQSIWPRSTGESAATYTSRRSATTIVSLPDVWFATETGTLAEKLVTPVLPAVMVAATTGAAGEVTTSEPLSEAMCRTTTTSMSSVSAAPTSIVPFTIVVPANGMATVSSGRPAKVKSPPASYVVCDRPLASALQPTP